MSVTRHRRGGDLLLFETPTWATAAILPHVLQDEGYILEPAAGRGAVLQALIDAGVSSTRLLAFEVNPAYADSLTPLAGLVRCPRDTLMWAREGGRLPPAIRLILTNPPFALDGDSDGLASFALAMLDVATEGTKIVMLGRLTWAAPSRRRSRWLRQNMPDVYVLDRRPAFVRYASCPQTKGVDGRVKGCGWRGPTKAARDDAPVEHGEPPAGRECLRSGKLIAASLRSDAEEYAWYVWTKGGVGRAPTWAILDTEPALRPQKRTVAQPTNSARVP